MALDSDQLATIDQAREVVIVTRRGDRVFDTIIWVVVDDDDVFIRSVQGEEGRWYRRAIADPNVTLVVGIERFDFEAVPSQDPTSIERASDALRRKYRGRSLENMLLPKTLPTTLRLDPV